MNQPFPDIDRLAPARRPAGSPSGYHVWSNLLFLHWRVPPALVRPLIPRALDLDTWDGDAWVGLVPFEMSGVRPRWAPPCPGISRFCETNVRTYVHHRGRDPGVWFFSLDASSSLAVRVARWKWHLPYYRARMQIEREGQGVHYSSRRLWPKPAGASSSISAMPGAGPDGAAAALAGIENGHAIPGTLEHFLIERYILYAATGPGELQLGRVHHAPYSLRPVQISALEETLLPAAGIYPTTAFCHAVFCDRVRVEVFPLRPVDSA